VISLVKTIKKEEIHSSLYLLPAAPVPSAVAEAFSLPNTRSPPLSPAPQAVAVVDIGDGALPVKGRRAEESSAAAHHGRWWGLTVL
jgi:hypothetical protein